MPATCVPQYVPRANTGLSKHGDPVFPHSWSWNQNLACVCARGGRGTVLGMHPLPPVLPLSAGMYDRCIPPPRPLCGSNALLRATVAVVSAPFWNRVLLSTRGGGGGAEAFGGPGCSCAEEEAADPIKAQHGRRTWYQERRWKAAASRQERGPNVRYAALPVGVHLCEDGI